MHAKIWRLDVNLHFICSEDLVMIKKNYDYTCFREMNSRLARSLFLLVSWNFWTFICIQLPYMVGSTGVGREMQQQASQQRQLQANTDNTNTLRHAPREKSFLVSDGSWVDCIPLEGQIAAHHPALKGHKIQMGPSPSPRRSCNGQSSQLHPQLFAREQRGCSKASFQS